MISIIVNIIGILIIAAIIWWFWFSQTASIMFDQQHKIIIKVKDGVYQPSNIILPTHSPITLQFIREDPTPCSEYVNFDSLKISKQLPLNKAVDIQLTLPKPGEYEFTCQMGMYRGKLIAK